MLADHIYIYAMPLKNDLLDGFELGTIFGDFRELMQYFRVGDINIMYFIE